MLCAASVELPMGSRRTFFPVACSKVKVTGMLYICVWSAVGSCLRIGDAGVRNVRGKQKKGKGRGGGETLVAGVGDRRS